MNLAQAIEKDGGEMRKFSLREVQEGLRMALRCLSENPIDDPRVHQPVTNSHLLKCKRCDVDAELECKQCKHTGYPHYWIKLYPIDQNNQKYMCLNCDEVK